VRVKLTAYPSPLAMLKRDMSMALGIGLVVGLAARLVSGLAFGFFFRLRDGIVLGLALGLAAAIAASVYASPWVQWQVAHAWPSLRRRTPWRCMPFSGTLVAAECSGSPARCTSSGAGSCRAGSLTRTDKRFTGRGMNLLVIAVPDGETVWLSAT
jgi:hypothetical protein